MDSNAARQSLSDGLNAALQTINLSRTHLNDLLAQQQAQQERDQIAQQFAYDNRITAPFYDIGGTVYRTSDRMPAHNPQEYIAMGGKGDFSDVQKIDLQKLQQQQTEQSLVTDLAAKYADAGISSNDSLATAQSKLQKSKIYQDQVRGPVGSGGGGGSASSSLLGLTNQQIDNISPLVSQFQNSPIVQNYNTIGEGYSFAKSLSNDTKNPADDQALIYALAKALDPGSVVREGEYATVQKYAQSMVQSYGKSITQALSGSGFLSQDARNNIKKTIESRFRAAETSYNNLYSETSRRINLIGSTDKGDQLLNNYGGAFAPKAPSSSFVGPMNPISQPEQDDSESTENKDGWWKKTTNWLFGD
jgi:hypothetical protein